MDGQPRGEGAQRFEALLEKRRPWLLSQARNLCRSSSDAEDLVQETFLRFLSNFATAEGMPSESVCTSYLATTLTHCFYNQLKRQRTRDRSASDPNLLEGTSMGQASGAESSVFDRISDEEFSTAVESLSPRIRATVEMYAKGQRYHEISAALGVPMGTVAKRLYDARSKLRALLEPLLQSRSN
jgi:RNA polymerase sigma factor (sigma-70 family)